jgi:tetratricopeptide (TPR) repeat protein
LFEDSARFAVRAGERLERLKEAPFEERMSLDPLLAVMAVNDLAIARRELGQAAEAWAAHTDAVARMKALAGPKANRDELFWACEVRRQRARTAAAIPERRAAEADELVEVIRVAEKLVDDHPQLPVYREKLAETYLLRGELLAGLGRLEPAGADLTKSLTVSRELIDRFGAKSAYLLVRGRTFLALGRVRAAAGKSDDAVADWKKAATVFGLALKADPDNFHHRRGQAEAERALNPPAK